MLKIKLLLISLLLAVIVFFGCNIQSIGDTDQPNTNLTFTEFLKVNNFQEMDDCYIYEGDIAFDKSEVVRLYNDFLCGNIKGNMNNRGNIAINPNTGSRWVWTSAERLNITYRFNGSMATRLLTDAQVRSAFREAAARWMNVANVRFNEVTSGGVFVVQTYRVAETLDGTIPVAHSFFPHSYYAATFEINLVYLNGEAPHFPYPNYQTMNEMTGLMTHELGHVLGLAHEHQRADSPDQQGQGTYGEAFRNYDAASIMNYANSPYTSGISQGDIAVLNYLYPPLDPLLPPTIAWTGPRVINPGVNVYPITVRNNANVAFSNCKLTFYFPSGLILYGENPQTFGSIVANRTATSGMYINNTTTTPFNPNSIRWYFTSNQINIGGWF